MTPKEKAKELVDKYLIANDTIENWKVDNIGIDPELAKQCALIAVDLAIEAAILYVSQEVAFEKSKEYWLQVKCEILNL